MHGYRSALNYINRFQFYGLHLGLERIVSILEALGSPEETYPSVHVAGTNGKGSTCAMIASILQAAGYRVGLYTSPHLSSLRERFRIGDTMISEGELTREIQKIRHFVERGYELSYFEYSTAIAMDWFAEKGVDLAVIETGLGGRLDATNVIVPLVSVITNVSLEHQSHLGNTISKIAREKAGIIKREIPVVTGVGNGPAKEVILGKCLRLNAPLWELGRDIQIRRGKEGLDYQGKLFKINGIELGLKGSHQVANAGLAIGACEGLTGQFEITETAIRKGCRDVYWPGRGEMFYGSCRVLLDGAHNIDGVRSLKGLLLESGELHSLLWGCTDEGGDKDFVGMLRQVAPLFREVIITEPPGPRAPVTLDRWRESYVPDEVVMEQDWQKALYRAVGSCNKTDLLCVAGSLYLIGAVREELMEGSFTWTHPLCSGDQRACLPPLRQSLHRGDCGYI